MSSMTEAQYQFMSAELGAKAQNKSTEALLPGFMFYPGMAKGMLELARAIQAMSAKIDAIEARLAAPANPVTAAALTKSNVAGMAKNLR